MEMLKRLYRFPIIRAAAHRFGPAVWRLPRVLRKGMTCEAALRRLPGSKSYRYGHALKVRPRPPIFADGGLLFNQKIAMQRYKLPPPFVTRLPEAWLVGKHATPVTPDGHNLLSSFRDAPRIFGLEANEDLQSFLAGGKFASPGKSSQVHWQNVCPLVSRLDPNYFHWMVESCGSLQGVAHYTEMTGIHLRILIRGGGNAYIRASLELLGFSDNLLEWPPDSEPGFVEGMIIPSLPGNRVACSPESLKWLRGTFLAAAGVDAANMNAFRRIYIRRKPGGWRSVANDDAVAARLEGEGFEIARPEGLSLAEQIRLFAGAKIIVGMHGAGLTNLLFAPFASILELTGAYGGGEYLSMASGLEMPYACVRCAAQGDDIVVDTEKLLRAIERLTAAGRSAERNELPTCRD